MNLILLFPSDFISTGRARLTGRRFEHVRDIHRVHAGEELSVGVLNGQMGKGTITAMGDDAVEMDVRLDQEPPPALPLTLVMALPRPNVLKRTLICAASLGIKRVILLNFFRVEKSLWNSSALRPEVIREQLILGLEQSKDTLLPQVELRNRFRPFVEDELPALAKGALTLVAQPGSGQPLSGADGPATLIIGPEGGILDDEIRQLTRAGARAIDLGPRILKVETVLPLIVGKLLV